MGGPAVGVWGRSGDDDAVSAAHFAVAHKSPGAVAELARFRGEDVVTARRLASAGELDAAPPQRLPQSARKRLRIVPVQVERHRRRRN